MIALHDLHEMTLEEVAAVLDISVGTAKSRLAYGLTNPGSGTVDKPGVRG